MAAEQKKKYDSTEVTVLMSYKNEAEQARLNRINDNKENFNVYHHRQDWSHKLDGQSTEFIPKQSIAVEQSVAFLKQGLLDQGDWFSVKDRDAAAPGVGAPNVITSIDMQKLLTWQLEACSFPTLLDDSLKLGFLGSLMIGKVVGEYKNTLTGIDAVQDPGTGKFSIQRRFGRFWSLKMKTVRQQDWYPDPTGRNRYTIERIETDWDTLMELARANPGVYEIRNIESLRTGDNGLRDMEKSRETGQVNSESVSGRRRIILYELWGDILEPGTGELLHQNCQFVCSEDGVVVMKPRKNPFWHQMAPYVVAPIIRVPHSVWHRALMDIPTMLNKATNELFNLMLDEGLMNVFGISQIREDYLEDPNQVSGGVPPGTTLRASASTPSGMKVFERLTTAVPASNAFNMYQILGNETLSAAMSNDFRTGNIAERNVKATEIVAANQAINTVTKGIAMAVESDYVVKLLELGWLTIAQHADEMNPAELKTVLGAEKAALFLSLNPAQIYAQTALGKKFQAFGLSNALNKINDYKKITTLLQTIGVSPEMMAEFRRKYSMTKVMGEIIKALDIKEEKILAEQGELDQAAMENQLRLQAMQAETQKGGGVPGRQQAPGSQANITQARNLSDTDNLRMPAGELQRGSGEQG